MTIQLKFVSPTELSDLINSTNTADKEIPHTTKQKIINFLKTVLLYGSGVQFFTFIHELGHALSYKILTGKGSTIYMTHTHLGALTRQDSYEKSKIKMAIVSFSGHFLTLTVGSMLFLGTFCLPASKAYILSKTMLVKHFLRVSIAHSLFQEITYAVFSVANKNDSGDFSAIRRYGKKYVIIFGTILTSILGITIFHSVPLIKAEYKGWNTC